MQIAMAVMMVMVVMMMMMMAMPVIMGVVMMVILPLPLDRSCPASANRAHQITSISLIRISSPPTGINRPPPQSGQGDSRSAISTSATQS
jgi:hypothetical protein